MSEQPAGDIESCPNQVDPSSATTSATIPPGMSRPQSPSPPPRDDQAPDLPREYTHLRYNNCTLLQLVSFIMILAILVCTLALPSLKDKQLFELALWKWGVMLLVVTCGRLVSGWGIYIVIKLIERDSILRKRVSYFVYGLRKSFHNCVWLTLVLITWRLILDKRVEELAHGPQLLRYLTKISICLLVGSFVWLVKVLVVKVLASSFYVSTFFDRIQKSLFKQYVIQSLSAGPPREKQDQNPHILQGINIEHLHGLNKKNVSSWNMKRLMDVIGMDLVSALDEGATPNDVLRITDEQQAKVAAGRIFNRVVKQGSTCIYLEDLMRFLKDDEALKAIRLLDGECETKGFSKEALENWVVKVFQERRDLAASLNDTKTTINKLHQMLNVFVAILISIIWLLILKLATTDFFIIFSSQVLLFGFMFDNQCKTTFKAIIFLFVMHPFDVGDRCEIDGVEMIVEEMNILTTVFLRFDKQKIIYPNSVLATKPIANYYRSQDMEDEIKFSIHIKTSGEKIVLLKQRITSYIKNKSDHWYAAPMIIVRDVEGLDQLKFSLRPSHRTNFQNMSDRWERRALLIEELIKVFGDLDIEYRMDDATST